MTGFGRDTLMRLTKVLNVVMISLCFGVAWFCFYASRTKSPFYNRGNYAVLFIFVVLYFLFTRIYDGFRVGVHRYTEILYSQGLASFFTNILMFVLIWLLSKVVPNPLPLLISFVAELVMSALWGLIGRGLYFATYPPKKTAVVHNLRTGLDKMIKDYKMTRLFKVEASFTIEEVIDDVHVLDGMEAVFLSDIHSKDRNKILKYCIDNGIELFLIPRIGDTILSGAKRYNMFHIPMLNVNRYTPEPEYVIAKRLMDIIVSAIALVVFSPVMLAITIAIKAEDHGPVLYRQRRLTKGGNEFFLIKFRSMKVDAESDGIAKLSTGENDARVTKTGKFIRRLRLDELPQLAQIFTGTMSLVGPRPERPEIAAEYEKVMPEFRLRLQCKAGLTGYAQVYGKYNTSPYDKLQLDLMYIAKPSIIQDISILFATFKLIFQPESTEGVVENVFDIAPEKIVKNQGK